MTWIRTFGHRLEGLGFDKTSSGEQDPEQREKAKTIKKKKWIISMPIEDGICKAEMTTGDEIRINNYGMEWIK